MIFPMRAKWSEMGCDASHVHVAAKSSIAELHNTWSMGALPDDAVRLPAVVDSSGEILHRSKVLTKLRNWDAATDVLKSPPQMTGLFSDASQQAT